MNPVTVISGDAPIILAQPHSGIFLPDDVREALSDPARALRDTDWHIPQLYEGLVSGATVVRANFSRYVVDANRPPDDQPLYPGQNSTGLVPLHDFDGTPIWLKVPDEAEIGRRVEHFHRPYHDALRGEIERVRALHGHALLYDCHSIRSAIPFLFEGKLPDLNIGTNSGASCAPLIERAAMQACEGQQRFTHVLNGRFKGGWTTRHYGQPEQGVHALQMEICQSAYLESEEPPFNYSLAKAEDLRAVLASVLDNIRQVLGELK